MKKLCILSLTLLLLLYLPACSYFTDGTYEDGYYDGFLDGINAPDCRVCGRSKIYDLDELQETEDGYEDVIDGITVWVCDFCLDAHTESNSSIPLYVYVNGKAYRLETSNSNQDTTSNLNYDDGFIDGYDSGYIDGYAVGENKAINDFYRWAVGEAYLVEETTDGYCYHTFSLPCSKNLAECKFDTYFMFQSLQQINEWNASREDNSSYRITPCPHCSEGAT